LGPNKALCVGSRPGLGLVSWTPDLGSRPRGLVPSSGPGSKLALSFGVVGQISHKIYVPKISISSLGLGPSLCSQILILSWSKSFFGRVPDLGLCPVSAGSRALTCPALESSLSLGLRLVLGFGFCLFCPVLGPSLESW
uniref:Uncharacterized protein n=1 Tax=Cannabis sativa TaxID=3483 RepID=A0A803QDI1_CANSA